MYDPKAKTILVAVQNDFKRGQICELLKKFDSPVTLVQAKDGYEADLKLANALPHVALLETNMPRVTGTKIAEWLILSKKEDRVGIILFGKSSANSVFANELATSRVQYLEEPVDVSKFNEIVTRALAFSSGVLPRPEVKPKQVTAGTVLMREGDKGESIFLVIKGSFLAVSHVNGKDLDLGLVNAGEFVGEMSYINGEPRNATVKALEDSELIEIPNELMDQILQKKPQWMKALLKTLSRRLKIANTNRA